MVGADVEKAIVARAKGLFDLRGISQREFATAIGTSASWVSAFFNGRRPANDIHLLLRIARFFGVTVGYLLGEGERGRTAEQMTLLSTYEKLPPKGREAVLNLALTLRPDEDTSGPAPGEPRAERQGEAPRNAGGRKTPPAAKGRER